uniref:flagellar hook-length control protein FliK n=1 Tax=Castellaniella defragrans TaxID=75697 RepID=UPI00333F1ED9
MNVPPIPAAASGAQIPGPAGDAIDVHGFSDTLSQRRNPLHAVDVAPRKGKESAKVDEAQRPLTPEETLALLAAGATLPLMGATLTMARGEASVAAHGAPLDARARSAAAASGPAGQNPRALRADPRATPAGTMETAGHAGKTSAGNPPESTNVTLPGTAAGTAAPHRSDAATQGLAAPSSSWATLHDARSARSPSTIPAADPTTQATATAATLMTRQDSAAQRPGAGPESLMAPLAASLPQTTLPAMPDPQANSTAPAVAAALGDPAWPTDFSRQVLALVQNSHHGAQTAELRLNPPDLGPLRIVLHINDSVAQALFVSPHAPVRHALENALPQLQQQLAQAGLSLGQADVSDQQPGQQAFAQKDSPSPGKADGTVFPLAGETLLSNEPDLMHTTRHPGSRAANALVDTFV